MALSANPWAAKIAKQVGKQVAHYRARAEGPKGKRGMTAQALADRCTELELPMDRAVIAKLEKGIRQTITMGEILVLARALNVAPVLLIFPIGQEDEIEAVPGESVDTWAALRWFTGEAERLPGDVLREPQEAEPVRLYREHERLVGDWVRVRQEMENILATREAEDLREFRAESEPDAVDARLAEMKLERMSSLAESIQFVRAEIRERGLTPPPLPAEAAYIEPGGGAATSEETTEEGEL
jgi:transcriptional regulator with XRE-family HTH domain